MSCTSNQERGGWTGKHGATHWLQLKGSCAAPALVRGVPQAAGGSSGVTAGWCALLLPSKDSVELPGAVTLPQGHRGRNRRDAAGKVTSLPTQTPVTLKGEKKLCP